MKQRDAQIPADVLKRGKRAIAIYRKAIARGESPRFAEMVAMQQAPRGSTDSTFFAGVGTLDRQLKDKRARKRLEKNATKAGIHLTGNEFYQPGLARFPLDPMACISHGDGKAEIRKRIEKSGTGCEGAITVKGREPDEAPQKKFKLHPRLVRQQMHRELADPANAKVDRRELVEKIVATHGSP